MKKILVFVTAVLTAIVFTACSEKESAATEEPSTEQGEEQVQEEATNVDAEVEELLTLAKNWSLERVDGITENATLLEEAIAAGDYDKAKEELWLATQLEYEKGEALFATLSAELDETMDVSTETGFHGLEQILWGNEDPSTKQQELLDLISLLKEDAAELKQVVENAELNEHLMFEAMTGILPELSGFVESVYTGESISGTRIEDARSVFDGVKYYYDAVSPKVEAASSEVDAKVRDQIEVVDQLMAEEEPAVETIDQEFGALFNLMIEAATTIGVEL